MANEKLKIGFYGGKFLPFHIGHAYAAIKALESCDVLYLILFHGGEQEEEIQKNKDEYPLPNSYFWWLILKMWGSFRLRMFWPIPSSNAI